MKTIDRNLKQLWRDGWVQLPEIMVGICLFTAAITLIVPNSMHKLSQGPREYKFRNRYEVVRKEEIPPYLRDYPDCMN